MPLEGDKYTTQLHEDLFDNVLLCPVDYFAVRSLIILKMQYALLCIQVFRVHHGPPVLVSVIVSDLALFHPQQNRSFCLRNVGALQVGPSELCWQELTGSCGYSNDIALDDLGHCSKQGTSSHFPSRLRLHSRCGGKNLTRTSGSTSLIAIAALESIVGSQCLRLSRCALSLATR